MVTLPFLVEGRKILCMLISLMNPGTHSHLCLHDFSHQNIYIQDFSRFQKQFHLSEFHHMLSKQIINSTIQNGLNYTGIYYFIQEEVRKTRQLQSNLIKKTNDLYQRTFSLSLPFPLRKKKKNSLSAF